MNEEVRPDYSSIYSSESNRKKTVGLTVRRDLLFLARKYGINLSKLLENVLIQKFEAQTEPFSFREGFLFGKRKGSWCSGRDSNPGLRLERPEYLVHA